MIVLSLSTLDGGDAASTLENAKNNRGRSNDSCRTGDAHFLPRLLSVYSHLSLRFASSLVCHCILPGRSAPPRFNGVMWSTV